eukprot:scaffold24926_cov67-Phaeocystis_antarctica.AAC.2
MRTYNTCYGYRQCRYTHHMCMHMSSARTAPTTVRVTGATSLLAPHRKYENVEQRRFRSQATSPLAARTQCKVAEGDAPYNNQLLTETLHFPRAVKPYRL